VLELKTSKYYFLKGHEENVLTVDAFENYILSAGKDKLIKLWKKTNDLFEFKQIATFFGHNEAIASICFSPKTASFFVSCS